jgi:CDP-paratose 2-epimerase
VKKLLITGGAGFIGANAVVHYARSGWDVTVLDNLSRAGSERNLEWLRAEVPFRFHEVDVRDARAVEDVVGATGPDVVLHLAGQVAVTTSVQNPREDFEVNALGSFNVLEAIRLRSPASLLIYSSTNKVYGDLASIGVEEKDGRWGYRDLPAGVPETQGLDFHSPYGCSKGTADQYALDYGKSYGIRAVTMRQSCIYGPRQFGVEDQGWLAWFVIAAVTGKPITIFGDGKQTRDVLWVGDLLEVYDAAIEKPDASMGQAFNIGGGPRNTLSLLELIRIIERQLGLRLEPGWEGWRVGDQKVFVCDATKAKRVLGWEPRVGTEEGVGKLIGWVRANRGLF